jgi:hypothetical protein
MEPYYRYLITSWPILIIWQEYWSPGDLLIWRIRLNTTGVTEGMLLLVFKYYFFYVIQ